MGIKYLDSNFDEFIYHKESLAEGDYNYYLYIHPLGQILIMREKIADSECLYADGGFNASTAWTNRVSLNYKYYSQLA